MTAPDLSIVIPLYREEKRLPPAAASITDYLNGFPHTCEVLLAVEQCDDSTWDVARSIAKKDPRFIALDTGPQRGKGKAVRFGVLASRGHAVLYMDVDLSVPLSYIGIFYQTMCNDPDGMVWIGNRLHAQSRITRPQPVLRTASGRLFNRMARLLGITRVSDTQCGFKLFRGDIARQVFRLQRLDGLAFDIEVLLLAERLGYPIRQLPVEWADEPDTRVKLFGNGLGSFCDLVRIRRMVNETCKNQSTAAADLSS